MNEATAPARSDVVAAEYTGDCVVMERTLTVAVNVSTAVGKYPYDGGGTTEDVVCDGNEP